ncbi:AfsR/SARP family transcriptional regulator [Bradyrhizobium oligotrophicum]|uniref:AfsR/SARP family transcriptional regulator n=1 Tax=Bradyrhizobium oligotrophicum TaxID=44255 RepID=UPI003EBFCC7B
MTKNSSVNLALFATQQKLLFADFFKLYQTVAQPCRIFVIAADVNAVARVEKLAKRINKSGFVEGKSFVEMALLRVPISFRDVAGRIERWVAPTRRHGPALLVVDMSWGLETNSATANFEGWPALAETLTQQSEVSIASLYNRRVLIDEQLLVALRGHPQILTSAGLVDNPHWLPSRLQTRGALREQVDFWLGAIAPELRIGTSAAALHAAEGADPMWLLRRSAEEPSTVHLDSRDRWKIRCFGRLRIYRNDGSQVNWDPPGGATRKTKTLFAYLLQKGGHGAATDELADLLWPNAEDIEAARNRLYHTVRYLRLALGQPNGRDETRNYVRREGSRYVLVPPERSWLDISTFEQLCRQSQGHIKAGASDEALICLQAADRLYTGDLFEDIPVEYADDGERDWCWSKRYWLRDMFFKVQRDAARIYLERNDHSAALAHCQKALAIDPLCEMAHAEAMRVFKAQGRREAIDRQFKLYLDSLKHFDNRPKSASLQELHRKLTA